MSEIVDVKNQDCRIILKIKDNSRAQQAEELGISQQVWV